MRNCVRTKACTIAPSVSIRTKGIFIGKEVTKGIFIGQERGGHSLFCQLSNPVLYLYEGYQNIDVRFDV